MHEDTITAVAEEERNGLVLTVGFWCLRVGDKQVNLLAGFVKTGERLAATVDALARREQKYWIHRTGVVAAALDERERKQLYLGGVVVDDMTGLGQNLTAFVF